ncbi:MAG: GAF domain-containing sensor histidine kinase [Chloroflexota bacterium]
MAKPYKGPERRKDHSLRIRRYRRLLEVTRTLSSTLDLPHLLRNIIESARELTDTEAVSIMLMDASTGQLRFEAITNKDDAAAMERIPVPIEGSIAGTIFTTAKPLIIADAASDPRHFRKVDNTITFVTRSILGAPLISKEKPIGVLQVLNKMKGSFTQDDVEILEALATQAAVAIVNARLFQQSDLIAEMVHELRTPLTSISACGQLLLRPGLPPDKRDEVAQVIQNETARLAAMTTDFLDLARLESGRAHFEREPFDMDLLCRECINIVTPQAAHRGVEIHFPASQPAAPKVNGDRSKIKQVVLNLLTNAIKYNRENGQIYVAMALSEGAVKVSVRDTGRGIPAEALPRMFEKFYRVPDSEGYTQGTGLGLAIAKRIVETHGGEMSLESEQDVGTTFCFTLPLDL